MNRQQFIIMAFFTAAETYYFNEAIMSQRYVMALLWAVLILRNFRVSYIMGKIVSAIEDHFKGRK